MISWTRVWVLAVVVVAWVCPDVVLIAQLKQGGGWWGVAALLLKGLFVGLFFFMLFEEMRSFSPKNCTDTPSGIHPSYASSLTMPAMAEAVQGMRANLQPDDPKLAVMKLVQENALLLVDGLMLAPQLTSDNLLGEGAFGRVYQLHLADVQAPVCMKVKKDTHEDYFFMWEINNLQRLAEVEGVPRVKAVSVVPEGFIMTMHGRRTLESWLKIWQMTLHAEKEVAEVLRKLCVILINLHSLGLCHNDLKGDNVTVEFDKTMKRKKRWIGCKVTLVDFALLSKYGSHPYGEIPRLMIMPHNDPALMRGERTCSEATDVFSMGYLLHRALPLLTSHRQRLRECSQRAMGPCRLRPSFVEIEKELSRAVKYKGYFW